MSSGVEVADQGPKRRGPRKSVIGSSPHKDEYLRLLRAGWSSSSLERYAAYRFGEDIKAATFRQYKFRMKIEVEPSVLMDRRKDPGPVSDVDVMKVREELVVLQMHRIAIDAQHERDMTKLFSTTGREIDLLSKLLDAVKADQRDYGILPSVPVALEVSTGPLPNQPPRSATLGEVLGLQDPKSVMAAAEALANVVPFPEARRA